MTIEVRTVTRTCRRLLAAALTIALFGACGFRAKSQALAPRNAGDRIQRKNADRRVSFLNDIEPILTRAGCNAGACHGQQFGKGGFKLSLAGYDPELDYDSIVKSQNGRRVNRTEPTRSLLLEKPALIVPHQGGLHVARDSGDFGTIVRWLQEGAP